MKELKKKRSSPLDGPVPKQASPVKSKSENASNLSRRTVTEMDEEAGIFSNENLSHPANAEPLADLIGQLQQSHGNAYVQRLVSGVKDSRTGSEAASEDQQLDPATKAQMESSFGQDLGDVRVRTDRTAQEAAEREGARAFTRGRDIFFAAGEYDPTSREGLEVIGHEVAHILQQRNRQGDDMNPSHDVAESEAHEVGKLVASGQQVRVKESADASTIHRMAAPPPALQPQAGRTETVQKPAQQQPKAPEKKKAPEFELTAQIMAAAKKLATDQLYEDEQVALYVASEDKRPAIIINQMMQLFPAAWQEIIKQQPADVNRTTFLEIAGHVIWAFVRDPLTNQVSRRYQSDAAFRQKVDRARGKSTPAAPPAGGAKT